MNRPTEAIVITLVLLMIFYIAYGKYYYSVDGFENGMGSLPTMTSIPNIGSSPNMVMGGSLPTMQTMPYIVGSPTMQPMPYIVGSPNMGMGGSLPPMTSNPNIVITSLPADSSNVYSVSGPGSISNSLETRVSNSPYFSTLTDKQKVAQLIADRMSDKTNKQWMIRILTRLENLQNQLDNPDPNVVETVYNAALPEKPIFDAVIRENNIKDMTFDDFFVALNEIAINQNKTSKTPFGNFAVKYEPLLKAWETRQNVSASQVASASASQVASASAPPSASQPAPTSASQQVVKQSTLPDLEKLIQVIKPAPTTTVQPSASASQIGTVVNTSPGLQQGNQYAEAAAARIIPPMRPRCVQPRPSSQPSCACQQPIMPDGKPFDPNMYIRKDSIPCWNCQLPI